MVPTSLFWRLCAETGLEIAALPLTSWVAPGNHLTSLGLRLLLYKTGK